MEKTFLAFNYLVLHFVRLGLANIDSTLKLEILYVNSHPGHFFLNINDQVICDPWADIFFPKRIFHTVTQQGREVYESGEIKPYFLIDHKWQCYQACGSDEGSLMFCQSSTDTTWNFFNGTSDSAIFDKVSLNSRKRGEFNLGAPVLCAPTVKRLHS